jgi:hypothetical protein
MENCELCAKRLFTCCLPVHRPHEKWLGSSVNSVWQICLLLYQASDIGLVTMVKDLLKKGPDFCAKTDDSRRALHGTALRGITRSFGYF